MLDRNPGTSGRMYGSCLIPVFFHSFVAYIASPGYARWLLLYHKKRSSIKMTPAIRPSTGLLI